MTQTQVGYWQNVESNRHNVASEFQAANELAEKHRSNLMNEGLTASTINENVRHNKKTEGIEKSKVKETTRHNKTGEKETVRHNVTSEDLTKRSQDITKVLNEAIQAEKRANTNLTNQKAKIAAKDAQYYALNKIGEAKTTVGGVTSAIIALNELSQTEGMQDLKDQLSKKYNIKYDAKTKTATGTGKNNKGYTYVTKIGKKADGTTYPYIAIEKKASSSSSKANKK